VRLTNDRCWEHLARADHGVLCTAGARGVIGAVPVCFAVVGKVIASPVDLVKPKDTTELGRLKNLDREATATFLCERWSRHDWSQLWWVRAQIRRRSGHDVNAALRAQCEAALRARYYQYRGVDFADLLVFDVESLTGWSAQEGSGTRGE
jgi:hypothetical protein